MSGIAGIFSFNNIVSSKELIKTMTDKLQHRGPDGEGFYFDKRIALGHRQLAIIDLSESGQQPMSNEDGKVFLVFNGEIYNYKELKYNLISKGHIFKSNTDCEVVIHGYEEWGSDCVNKFNGMWSFAIWDSKRKILFCSRDRFGIKPFYYYYDDNRFVFASEIKAILTDKSISCQPNNSIIFDYIAYPYNDYIDHSEDTFFKGIKRLMPAHYMIVNRNGDIAISRYWDLHPASKFKHISDEEAMQKFYELFEDAVRLRLQGDVPIGTSLSGGLDSSSIVCMVDKLGRNNGISHAAIGNRQKAFSACFEDKSCDEREYIKAVKEQTNAETNFVFPDSNDLFNQAQKFITAQEEPVAGTSVWASWLVTGLAHDRGIKVLLNGQGADEILGGYSVYFVANLKDLFRGLKLRRLMNEIDKCSEHLGYNRTWLMMDLLNHFVPIHPFRWKRKLLGKEVKAFPSWLNKDFIQTNEHKIEEVNKYESYLDQSLYHFLTYERLPSLLRYGDRNSAAFSIESRLPFLDHRLVEFCFSLPSYQKIRNGIGKIVLRNALKEILPPVIHDRIWKIGFATPEDTWFKTAYRKEIEQIISSKSYKERGYFNVDKVMEHFRGFVNGREVVRPIWKYINLELWSREFFGR